MHLSTAMLANCATRILSCSAILPSITPGTFCFSPSPFFYSSYLSMDGWSCFHIEWSQHILGMSASVLGVLLLAFLRPGLWSQSATNNYGPFLVIQTARQSGKSLTSWLLHTCKSPSNCHSPFWPCALGGWRKRRKNKGTLIRVGKAHLYAYLQKGYFLLQRRPVTTFMKQPSVSCLLRTPGSIVFPINRRVSLSSMVPLNCPQSLPLQLWPVLTWSIGLVSSAPPHSINVYRLLAC